MSFLWFLLGLTVYLLIGGIVDNLTGGDLEGVIFFWPLFVFLFICVFTVSGIKSVAALLVNLFNRVIYGGEQNEKQEDK